LIEAGADVNVVNRDGETALYWTSSWGYSEIVKILKEAGAK
jgi:ankyrin repeat protein